MLLSVRWVNTTVALAYGSPPRFVDGVHDSRMQKLDCCPDDPSPVVKRAPEAQICPDIVRMCPVGQVHCGECVSDECLFFLRDADGIVVESRMLPYYIGGGAWRRVYISALCVGALARWMFGTWRVVYLFEQSCGDDPKPHFTISATRKTYFLTTFKGGSRCLSKSSKSDPFQATPWPSCNDCSCYFRSTSGALEDYKCAIRHGFCRHCDRFFYATRGLESHCVTLHNLYCPEYDKRFDFGCALNQHQNSTGHSYCRICERNLTSEGALSNHRETLFNLSCYLSHKDISLLSGPIISVT